MADPTTLDRLDPPPTGRWSREAAAEYVRGTLARPEQVHVVPPEVLATLLPGGFESLGCSTGGCDHLLSFHEAEDYTRVGTPIRPICTVDECPCGSEWRDDQDA